MSNVAMKQKTTGKKKEQTARKIAKAIIESHGLLSHAAKVAGVNRSTVYRYIASSKLCSDAVEVAREALYDTVESNIIKQIEDGNTTMLIFYAKTQMKDRGYIERQEIEIPSEVTINVRYVDKNKE